MTVLKGQVPKEREKSKPQHTKTRAVLRLEEDKRLMGNFYCPDGSGLQSLTQTNQQHSWDFFFFFLKQRFVGKAEAFTMHRAQQEQPAVLPAMLGRTNQLKPVATKEQNQTRRKRLLQRSCPLTKQSRGGGGAAKPHCPAAASPHTPLPASSCQGTPAAGVYVRSLPNHNCCTPPRAGWGWQRDASRPQGPPGQALSPHLARG